MRIKEKIKEKKGDGSAIESVIHYLLLIIALAFVLALIVNSSQHLFLNKIGNQASRRIAIQSGIMSTVPNNYPGGSEAYVTSGELNTYLSNAIDRLDMDKYTVYVNGVEINPRTNIQVGKGEPLEIDIICNYHWVGLNFIKGLKANTASYHSVVYGEYDKNL